MEHIIIYDNRSNDSLYCTAMLSTYLYNDKNINIDDITLYNYNEIPKEIINGAPFSINKQYATITFCGVMVDDDLIRTIYNGIGERLLIITSNYAHYNRIMNISRRINTLHKCRVLSPGPEHYYITNYTQSLSYTVYEKIYGIPEDVKDLPKIIQYIDGFVCDSYSHYGISRDAVIEADKFLSETYKNDVKRFYVNFNNIDKTFNNFVDDITQTQSYKRVEESDNILTKQIIKYGTDVFTCDGRNAMVIFTDEKLSQYMLLDSRLFENYECIVTFNRLQNENWQMTVYNAVKSLELYELDLNNGIYTLDSLNVMYNNIWNAGYYIKTKYNGIGNNICGYVEIDKYVFKHILLNRTI
jgi:hypothetical protein